MMSSTESAARPGPADRLVRLRLVRLRAAVAVAAIALFASSCALLPPTGAGPLRFRDEVFSAVTKTADLTYGSAITSTGTTQVLKFDLYEPTGDISTRRPLVIWVHGGSFKSGSKTSAELVDEATTLGKKGFVGASIDYRLRSPGCTSITADCVAAIHDAIADAQAAVRFFRANAADYRIDPDRIAIGGTSAGAITALNVGYRTPEPETSGTPGYPSDVAAAVSLSGAQLMNGNIGPGDAPALDFHGTADSLVPYSWAQTTITTAQQQGLEAYLVTWQGEGHVPYLQHRQQILDLTTNFLYNEMNLANAG